MAIWDDHEVRDNWYPTRDLSQRRALPGRRAWRCSPSARARRSSSTTRSRIDPDEPRSHPPHAVARAARRGVRARHAQLPRPEQREPADAARLELGASSGAAQLDWLKARLAASRATWKVIASDMPLGVDRPRRAVVLSRRSPTAIRRRRSAASSRSRICCGSSSSAAVRNVVWITGDVHYCAAHHYDPARARFTDFDPFWEFVAGPLHAGTFGPDELDADVRPRSAVHRHPAGDEAEPPAVRRASSSSARCGSTRRRRTLTAALHDLAGKTIYRNELEAAALNIHLVLLVVYSVGVVAFGSGRARLVRGSSDFFVAGRSLGPGLILSSMLAANIGAGSTVGVAGLAYRDGISAWWWVGSAGIGSLVFAFSVAPRLWRLARDAQLLHHRRLSRVPLRPERVARVVAMHHLRRLARPAGRPAHCGRGDSQRHHRRAAVGRRAHRRAAS